jgi:magnesium chelatase subunit H
MTTSPVPYRVVVVTLDAMPPGPPRACCRGCAGFPGAEVSIHAAAEWGETRPRWPPRKARHRPRRYRGGEPAVHRRTHDRPSCPNLQAARDRCDAFVGVIADPQIVKLTKMGDLDMAKPASGDWPR